MHLQSYSPPYHPLHPRQTSQNTTSSSPIQDTPTVMSPQFCISAKTSRSASVFLHTLFRYSNKKTLRHLIPTAAWRCLPSLQIPTQRPLQKRHSLAASLHCTPSSTIHLRSLSLAQSQHILIKLQLVEPPLHSGHSAYRTLSVLLLLFLPDSQNGYT